MPRSVKRLRSFLKDYLSLPADVYPLVEKVLRLLMDNPRHPSLQVKKIQGTIDIWEARVDVKRRITFQWDGETIILRRIGAHDIIDKESRRNK